MAHDAQDSWGGVKVFVMSSFLLALVTALGNRSGRPDAALPLIQGLFALGSLISLIWVRLSRRRLEAAGVAREEIQDEMASAWRGGAFMMMVLGAGGLFFFILGYDVLPPAERPWPLGTALVYTSAGIVLFLRNRPKRGS